MTSTGIDGKNRRGKSGIAVGNTPSSPTAGYFAWYDPTVVGGVLHSGVQATDGQTVSTWVDQAASGHNLTPPGTIPVFYKTTSAKLINGLPTIDMTSSGGLDSASYVQAQPLTVYCVGRLTDATNGGSAWQNNDGNNRCRLTCTTTYAIFAEGALVSGGTTNTSAHVMSVVMNGASSVLRVDGTQVASGNPGTAGINNGLILGQFPTNSGSNFPWIGVVGEFLFYAAAHNSTTLALNEAYLKGRWGTP